ncbi:unnamed protein product [Effrenium voratum]|nr:unnamed protein product [Effrenium voratum]
MQQCPDCCTTFSVASRSAQAKSVAFPSDLCSRCHGEDLQRNQLKDSSSCRPMHQRITSTPWAMLVRPFKGMERTIWLMAESRACLAPAQVLAAAQLDGSSEIF